MIKLGEVVMILDLHRQGLSVSAIALQLGIDRKTVRKYLARGLEAPVYGPRQPRPRRIDPFVPYLRERVEAWPGLTGRRLFRELKERGYQGGYTAVTDALRDLRPPAAPRVRGPLRDAARRPGAGRLRPVPGGVRRRAGGDPDRLAVLPGARLQPPALGPLRPAPGPADRAALPPRRLRGARRRAAPDPLRPDEDRGHAARTPRATSSTTGRWSTSPATTASTRRPAGPTGPRPRARSSGRTATSARTSSSPARSATSTT